ncbi:metal-dependent amidase/aminoacylase/carboxypeptidase family protein [Neorhizobium galegae]|nr:metal-dependent amidase/aminoacylase/carboxypeptidase family protein [Neorhizobium galegae]
MIAELQKIVSREIDPFGPHGCACAKSWKVWLPRMEQALTSKFNGEPAVVNDANMVEIIRRTSGALIGHENTMNAPGWTAADDFAFYSEKCRSVYFRLGIRNEEVGSVIRCIILASASMRQR